MSNTVPRSLFRLGVRVGRTENLLTEASVMQNSRVRIKTEVPVCLKASLPARDVGVSVLITVS